ncbi:hypothetical protein SNE40_004347 [Patella caerulea]|uniref:Sas10 C-terminal domain-containing protein n=1 Tax=Patella caerulea TaxID=87958 RepID=A0AAN8K4K4_PATCE
MGKRRKGFKPQDVSILDSDDERAFNNIDDPDPDSRGFVYDDIDEFHAGRDKVLLESGVNYGGRDDSEQEEVLPVVSDDDLLSDEDMAQYRTHLLRYKRQKIKEKMGSDLEDEDDEQVKKDNKGWGKKRSQFYGADFDEFVDLSGSDDDKKKAILEEKEALVIQKKMVEEMDEDDFGLDEFKVPDKKEVKPLQNQEKIVQDLSKLSKREKIELLKKESPELLTLIEDFKARLSEVKDTLQPLFKLVQEGKIVDKAAEYIKVKFHLSLSYCVNISFYLMLKAKHIATINHPVIKRLVQYRKLIKELVPVDNKLKKEVKDILARLKRGEDVNFAPKPTEFKRREVKTRVRERVEERRQAIQSESDSESENKDAQPKKKNKKQKRQNIETEAERTALEFYDMMKKKKKKMEEDEEDGVDLEKAYRVAQGETDDSDDMNEDSKRAITSQIQKNRGLTPSRKRELKNPRVRHRHKFRKAKIRRKGQVREVRTETHRYGGEMTGIRAGIKRGRKLK